MEPGNDVGYAPQENSFLSVFKTLPEKSTTTIRFFERSGSNDNCFYTVYGKDAHFVAQEFFKTNGAIKSFGSEGNKLDYVNMSRNGFETFVRDLLLVKQYKVEVFTNKSKTWKAEYKGSPGNLAQFEDLLFSSTEVTVNNSVVGVKLTSVNGVRTVGVAHINTNECIINLLEFEDCDGFTNFESVLVQLSPKEAVICGSSSQSDELQGIRQVLNRNKILINERPNADFDLKNITQDMGRLMKTKPGELENVAANPEMEKRVALSAAAAVIKYLELITHETCFGEFTLEPFDFRLYVKMDSAACRALHVGGYGDDDAAKAGMTVTAVIDKCRTAQGHRLLAQFLKQPLLDMEKLEERLDLVQIFVEDVILRQNLYEDHLRRIPDCQVLARKFMKRKQTLADCYKAYLCASKLNRIVDLLEQYDGINKAVLQSVFAEPLKALDQELSKYCDLIQSTLDLAMADRGEFVVKPEFDEGLAEIRKDMDALEETMAEEAYKVAKDLGLEANKSLKLESNGMYGHYFRVTLKEETSIRNVAGISILDSNKGGVKFRNNELDYLSQKYTKKRHAYETKQKDFVKDMLEIASGYYHLFEQLGNVTSFLDVIISFAVAAVGNAEVYVRPTLLPRGSGHIRLENLRHPCVETQKGVSFIPNDVNFEKGKESFYIVTGPNMGGKSTFLRSIGVATLLAHIGCFVPATVAEISIVDAILARVGAGDCLTKGVSTFMAEMIETSFILKTATADSMVLIDELGRGTSTYDGFGLCWAISEYLSSKVDCYCVLATHFHELTDLATQVPTVKNLHVTAIPDESGLQMLYKIEKGSCDRSFGLHVARITEFPENVLKEAREMALKLEDFCSENDLDDTIEGVKRRREEKKAGLEKVDSLLEQVKSSADKCQTEEEFKMEIEKLLGDFQADDNPYTSHILATLKEAN